MSLEVLIVDDQALCIGQLSEMVRERAPDASIEVADQLDGAAARLAGVRPDLVVVELSLPGLGREAGVGMLARLTTAPVLVLDARHDAEAMRACAAAGASGYATRASSRDLVAAAIAVLLAGGRYFPTSENLTLETPAPPAPVLSGRQAEILSGLMRGQTNLEIGERLGIALPTVKVHVRAVLRALGARNRTEAALLGRTFLTAGPQRPLAPGPDADA